MGAKYDLLKVTTIAGTIFSVYHTFTNSLLLEDLIIVILVAATIVAVAKDLNKERHSKTESIKESLIAPLEESIREQLAAEQREFVEQRNQLPV